MTGFHPVGDDMHAFIRGLQRNVCPDEPDEPPPPPPCPICRGHGYLSLDVPYTHPDFGNIVMCECKKRKLEEEEKDRKDRLVAQIQEEMGTLTRHTFETFRDHTEDMRDAREVCQYYARNAHLESTWLVLFGDPGLGKTHLAAATTNQCVQQGIPSRFLSVPQMITYIKQGIRADRGAMSVEDRLIELSKVRLLVLDDLGAHSPTAWANDRLFEVLQARYQDRLPTVITSNFPVAKSLAYDGQDERQAMQVKRMVSRFKEMAIVIKFIGEDYRGVASTEPRQ